VGSSVLEIVGDAYNELGLYPPPSSVTGATDPLTLQLTSLYTAVGQMLVKRRVWRGLLTNHTFLGVAGQTLYPLPLDYARPVNQTEWDFTNHWPLMGPMTPQQMQTLQSGIISQGPRIKFRMIGNDYELFPAPSNGQEFTIFYISKGWVLHVEGEGTQRLTKPIADADTCIFDDRLMVAGIKLRFFQAKGFDTTAYAEDFQVLLDDALAQDSGAQKLTMAADPATYLINVTNIPDGNVYGQP
jgi:hypothetical protein